MKQSSRNHKKKQTEILKLKNTMNEWKNCIEGFNGRLDQPEETMNKFKDRTFELPSQNYKQKKHEKE
jgi:hypothetical protein